MLIAFTAAASAAPLATLATLDRDGAWVSVEGYGPNVVHVTIAADKAEALKGPGYGILTQGADGSAFRQTSDANGDSFASSALNLHVDAAPPPHVPSQGEKYFAPASITHGRTRPNPISCLTVTSIPSAPAIGTTMCFHCCTSRASPPACASGSRTSAC